jgi:hypothetical protein
MANTIQEMANTIQEMANTIQEMSNRIDQLTNILATQKELIQQLRDEIARLKGHKPKPKIPSSKLEGPGSKPDWRKHITLHTNQKKSMLFLSLMKPLSHFEHRLLSELAAVLIRGSLREQRALDISKLAKTVIQKIRRLGKPEQPKGKLRKKKTGMLVIHESRVIKPENIPENARFKGFNRYTVQEIVFKAHAIQYQLERWQLPDGSYITGQLPSHVHGHYGPNLISYILHQYHACRVTEALIPHSAGRLRLRRFSLAITKSKTFFYLKGYDTFFSKEECIYERRGVFQQRPGPSWDCFSNV